jgi:uncharacterized protein (DUF305 family)
MDIHKLNNKSSILAALAFSALALPLSATADEPGRGLTAQYEQDFLRMMINHHYSALRITELAAGTDVHRDPQTTPTEGTSPTPGTASTPAKSRMDDVKSLARRNNRMQREEIMMAQDFLRKWYGVTHQPQLDEEGRGMIHILERAHAGPQFDHKFLEVFSRHHYMALTPSMTCVVASDIRHEALQRYCRGMVQAQLADIEEMREMLATAFNIVDYQPIRGLRGIHTGSEREGAQ